MRTLVIVKAIHVPINLLLVSTNKEVARAANLIIQ